jgi:hypothetical protein
MNSRRELMQPFFLGRGERDSRPVGKQWHLLLQEGNCCERLSFSDGLALRDTDGQMLVQPVLASHSMTPPLPKP